MLSWAAIAVIWLAAVAVAVMVLVMLDASAHHSDSYRWLERIRLCESGGDWEAVNERGSERHGNGHVGSYGGYQMGYPTWRGLARLAYDEGITALDYSHMTADAAPAEVQTAMAVRLWDGGRGAWHWRGCAEAVGYCDLEPSHCRRNPQ